MSSIASQSTSSTAKVDFELRNGIAYISFDHVAARNAMTVGMYESLKSICEDLAKSSAARVAILRGAGGKSFVSGSDITQFSAFTSGDDGISYEESIDSYLAPLAMLPIPTIAVIDGMAVGGGLAIASCCDFRISTPDARFGVPIAKTLGNCLSAGNVAWLVAHLGVNIVKRMLLLAELVTAPELLKEGYLLATYPAEALEGEANQLAERLMKLAPITQKSSKQTLVRIIKSNLPDCSDLIRECYGSEDFRNGVTAFLGGKPPVWTGK
ncbi:MAG: enoyl-CoA hydratase [Polynucleobacter sp. 24-46-87]|jgi:enoyl-CoA hydratase/carnithine racemase|uniref:enoyl-CoA hydratase/isomerase family protein n=1 Tax=unclassified Polynucleobacter TaxID=2640945 RepID=UPI000BD62974|nr:MULTISPECIES: enoyl-CoA hydratase/isomerase family protein [unclassified Polynucleobacter]OYY20807.1 MAG: enoyl-CoA hydratase [Polynucleobacter sp. 35-46-11]OZA15823.1 MAG: enoyl-CoA hydratase [Polynucleobacter sp. 24-46-87]OZA77309.1 MAG: enoyl-CoA hydratase [Polynucleobacter sp. 39-46-10]